MLKKIKSSFKNFFDKLQVNYYSKKIVKAQQKIEKWQNKIKYKESDRFRKLPEKERIEKIYNYFLSDLNVKKNMLNATSNVLKQFLLVKTATLEQLIEESKSEKIPAKENKKAKIIEFPVKKIDKILPHDVSAFKNSLQDFLKELFKRKEVMAFFPKANIEGFKAPIVLTPEDYVLALIDKATTDEKLREELLSTVKNDLENSINALEGIFRIDVSESRKLLNEFIDKLTRILSSTH